MKTKNQRNRGKQGTTLVEMLAAVIIVSIVVVGVLQFLIIPFDTSANAQFLRILAFDSPDEQYYQVPFDGYWGIVHLLFWCGWININVGIFNAIPMIPLDGGYILKEGVDRILDRRGLLKWAPHVVSTVSYVMLVMLMSLILLPYLLHI